MSSYAPARLAIEDAGGRRRLHRVWERPASLGRGADNVVVLDDRTVSSRHAVIAWDDEQATLTDLGSTNGTTVNGIRLAMHRPRRPCDEDDVRIGSFKHTYRAERAGLGLDSVSQGELTATQVHPGAANASSSPAPNDTVVVSQDGRDVVSVGRDPGCNVRLDHPQVSRRHADPA